MHTLYDLDKVNPFDKHEVTGLEPNGWYPVDIEYSYNVMENNIVYLVWRVKGVDFHFKIEKDFIDSQHGSNIIEHFTLTLERFYEHYMNWKKYGLSDEWKSKYHLLFDERIKK